MNWYFDSGVNDLVVRQNPESFEMFASPESWSNWGISDPKNLVGLDEYMVTDDALEYKELRFNGKSPCSEADKDQSSGSSVCGGEGLSEEILMESTVLRDQCDELHYQLRGLSALEEMDDIFLSCVPRNEDPNSMLDFSPESQCGMLPADNFFPNSTLDSQSMSSDMQCMTSSKYLKRHADSPSVGWEKGDITGMQFTPCSELPDCPPMKVLKGKVMAPSERNRTNGSKDSKSSLEESILHDLKTVMAKLPVNTRICFRDSLYRLANDSKQQHIIQSQDGDLGTRTTAPDEKLRCGEKGEMEAKTNAIDRAIGNLMFKNTDFKQHL